MNLDKSTLIEILSDYNLWGNFKKNLQERPEYALKLSENLGTNTINVIKGIRRSGKSSICIKYIQNNYNNEDSLIINLEDPRLPVNGDSTMLMELLHAYQEYINPDNLKIVVIDEVQNASGWERFARYLFETKNIKCIVTGSSAKLLSEEYATLITGRHIDIQVFPLSFYEYLHFKGFNINSRIDIVNKKFEIINMLNEYIEYGGFPEAVIINNKDVKRDLVKNYFNDIIIKDVAKRYKIRNISQLEQISMELLSNISGIASLRSISRSYNISLGTVERFFKYLSASYLFITIDKYNYSKRKQNKSLKKIYTVDTGIYNALSFKFSKQNGKIMENIVAIELFRRINNLDKTLYYWRDYQDHEVDFVITNNDTIDELLQVTYSSSYESIQKREIENIIKAGEELHCKNLKIITWDYEDVKTVDNSKIYFTPLWKFLIG
jgi:hypothetical protein